jgi:hypothetical protein
MLSSKLVKPKGITSNNTIKNPTVNNMNVSPKGDGIDPDFVAHCQPTDPVNANPHVFPKISISSLSIASI